MKLLTLMCGVVFFSVAFRVSASPPTIAAGSPIRGCEFRLASWCITEGAYVVTRTLATDRVHDRVWSLIGQFKADSRLLVQEPNGCKSGYANTLVLLSYESAVNIKGVSWDRARVRLKADGSCDLEILMTPSDGDPMEWAFSTGIGLIRGCKDEGCTPLPLNDLKLQIERKRKGLPD